MRNILLPLVLCFLNHTVPAQEWEGLQKINGTHLYLKVAGKGENLVVLHGGPGLNHHYFRPFLDDLERSFRLVYYDQRACGRSATPSPDSISLKFLVEDLEAIRKHLGIKKLNLLAHSWGAVLATHYALAYPGHVKKIIYSNPAMLSREYDQEAAALLKMKTSRADSAQRAQIMKSGNLDVTKYDRIMHLGFRASSYNPDNIDRIDLALPENFVTASRALFTGLMKDPAQGLNVYDSLKAFQFPVLIICGAADTVPLSSVGRMKNNLRDCQFEILHQSGHFPFVEEQKEYLKVIEMFLKHN